MFPPGWLLEPPTAAMTWEEWKKRLGVFAP